MTLDEFHDAAVAYDGNEEQFRDLLVTGIALTKISHRDLAYRIECIPSTIQRWIDGTSKPMKSVRKYTICIALRDAACILLVGK